MTTPTRGRRGPRTLTRSAAAVALALPLTLAAVAVPASAATAAAVPSTVLTDDWLGGYPPPSAYGGYGGAGGYGGFGSGYGGSTTSATAGLDTSEATAGESTGMVEITSTIDYGVGEAAGTGIVLGSDGLVVTNHHVVEGATAITVTDVSTGQTYTADVLGYDSVKDVAVLQLEDATGLATAITDVGSTALGDAVTAVGDAGGDGGSLTAAPGTIADAHEGITVTDEQTGESTRLRNLVEVSSDVVPGDSGGALLAADGDVVGMNVAASSGGTDVTGYVIPIGRVLRVVEAVTSGTSGGSVVVGGSPFLGVQLSTTGTTPAVAGVVAGSPAETLGLSAGDTVTAIGGTAVTTADGLRAAIATHEPGDSVTVTWTDRSGASHTASATLVQGPIG